MQKTKTVKLRSSFGLKKVKRANHVLENYFAFARSSKDGVFLVDKKSRIIFWNEGAENFLGLASSETSGKKTSEILKIYSEGKKHYFSFKNLSFEKSTNGKLTILHSNEIYANNLLFFADHVALPIYFQDKRFASMHILQDATGHRQLEFVNRLVSNIPSGIDETLKEIARSIYRFCPAEKTLIFIYGDKKELVRAKFFKLSSKKITTFNRRSYLSSKYLPNSKTENFFANDTTQHPKINGDLLVNFKVKKYLQYNLELREKTIATVILLNKKRYDFAIQDLKFLESISFPLASIIENSKLTYEFNKSIVRERRFISDVAHELRSPLTSLHGEIELALLKKRNLKSYRENLDSVLSDADIICKKLERLLDLTWSSQANIKGFKSFDLTSVIREVQEITEKLASGKKIKVNGRLGPPIYIKGDKRRLAQAFINISDNAVKFTQKQGKIDFKLETQGDKVKVQVSNNGIPIPHEELPCIFDRFYRGTNKAKELSSGMGLAIAKSIILAHQGTIYATSGKKTSFTITLPHL